MAFFNFLPLELKYSILERVETEDSKKLLQVSRDLRQLVFVRGPLKKRIQQLSVVDFLDLGTYSIKIDGDYRFPVELLVRLPFFVKDLEIEMEGLELKDGLVNEDDREFTLYIAALLNRLPCVSKLRLMAEFPMAKIFMEALDVPILDHLDLNVWGPMIDCDFYEQTGYFISQGDLTNMIEKVDRHGLKALTIQCHELEKLYKALKNTRFHVIAIQDLPFSAYGCFENFRRFLRIGNPGLNPDTVVLFSKRLEQEGGMANPEPFLICNELPNRKPHNDFVQLRAKFLHHYPRWIGEGLLGFPDAQLHSLFYDAASRVLRRDCFESQVSPSKRCAFMVSAINGKGWGYELCVLVKQLQ